MSGVIELPGVESSRAIREQLATEGRPVLLAFSGGKDALASWLALRESGIPVLPYYMYYVPGLRFVEDYLTYCESIFGCRIARYPHPSLYRWLNRFVFQAPERLAIIEAAQLPEPTYEQMLSLVREDQGLPADTWVADGVRAADSIVRRLSVQKHGAMKSKHHKVSVVWDWRKAHVFDAITSAGIDLALDYEWFGRSFDGIDARFTGPLREHAPEDYERILEWFPMAELDLVRQELAS